MCPDVVVFDGMDTLVADPFHELPGFFGLDMPGYLAAKDPEAWPAFETARLSEQDYLSTMFRDRRPVDGDALRAFLARRYRWVDGMETLVAELAASGVPMHVLSNYPVWYHIIEDELGLSRYVEWSFVSWDTGLRKPDPRAYRRAAARLGGAPGRLLLVDDRQDNVDAAVAQGWQAVRFQGVEALRDAFQRLGLPTGPAAARP